MTQILSGPRLARGSCFVSFEEWRKYVRATGVQTSREYYRLSMLKQRPRNIPSRPDIIYRHDGWTTWMNALGSDPRAVKSLDMSGIEVPLDVVRERNVRRTNFERARSWFLEIANNACGSEFEFFSLGRSSGVNLLFRRKEESRNSWAGLQFRSAVGIDTASGDRMYSFLRIVPPTAGIGLVAVCEAEHKLELLSPSEINDKRKHTSIYRHLRLRNMLDACSSAEIWLDKLRGLWEVLPNRCFYDWSDSAIDDGLPCYRIRLHRSLAIQATARVYHPACGNLHSVVFGEMFGKSNVRIDGASCLQKVAVVNRGSRNSLGRLTHPVRPLSGGIRRLCYTTEDNIDAFIFLIYEEKRLQLQGMFFLPAAYLLDRGYLLDAKSGEGGKTAVPLYPPGRTVQEKYTRFAMEQRDFYVDCSDAATYHEGAGKFKKILGHLKKKLVAPKLEARVTACRE